MIGIESIALSVGAASLGGLVAIVGAFSMPEGAADPWAVPVGSAGLSGIVFYVIFLREKAAIRSEERWDKHRKELMELLEKAGKTDDSESG